MRPAATVRGRPSDADSIVVALYKLSLVFCLGEKGTFPADLPSTDSLLLLRGENGTLLKHRLVAANQRFLKNTGRASARAHGRHPAARRNVTHTDEAYYAPKSLQQCVAFI